LDDLSVTNFQFKTQRRSVPTDTLSILLGTVLLVFAAWLYVPHLDDTLTYDEVFTVIHYSGSPISAFTDYSTPNNHMLHSFFIWLMREATGTQDHPVELKGVPLIAMRLPAFAAALISLALLYRIGLRYLPAPVSGFACIWLMLMPAFSAYATTARGYSLSIAATLALWWFCVERPRPRPALWLSAAAMLVLPSMLLLTVPLALWSLRWHRRLVVPLVIGTVSGVAIYLPALIYGLLGAHIQHFGYRVPSDLISDTASLAWAPVVLAVLLISVLGDVNVIRKPDAPPSSSAA
jgi:hypothetical protein